MNKLVARQRLVMTFTFFRCSSSGQSDFPPFVAQAGSATIPAAIIFPSSPQLACRFSACWRSPPLMVSTNSQPGLPTSALFLGVAIMLTIGPCFAIPRTGDRLIRNDGGPFRTVLPWLAGPTHLLARVLHAGVPVRPASMETLQSARPDSCKPLLLVSLLSCSSPA